MLLVVAVDRARRRTTSPTSRAARSSGNGRFGPYGMMHGSEGIIRLARLRAARSRSRRRDAVVVRARARAPAVRAVAIALRGQRGPLQPGTGCALLRAVGARSACSCSARCSRSCCRTRASSPPTSSPTPAEKRLRRQVHHRPVHRAHSAPALPGRAGGAPPEAGGARRRGPARRLPRRHAQARPDRRRRSGSSARSRRRLGPFVGEMLFGKDKFISATATSFCSRSAAAASSWRSRSRRV